MIKLSEYGRMGDSLRVVDAYKEVWTSIAKITHQGVEFDLDKYLYPNRVVNHQSSLPKSLWFKVTFNTTDPQHDQIVNQEKEHLNKNLGICFDTSCTVSCRDEIIQGWEIDWSFSVDEERIEKIYISV
jgi:hypothetical protein